MRTITRSWIRGAMLVGALGCSTSNVGSDASPDAGPISDPIAFCKSSKSIECDRAYECVPAAARDVDFMTIYGSSLTDCKSMLDAICTDPTTNCPTFDAASAGSCAAALSNDSCSDLVFGNRVVPPDSCSAACGM
jgi:hypothetical protein